MLWRTHGRTFRYPARRRPHHLGLLEHLMSRSTDHSASPCFAIRLLSIDTLVSIIAHHSPTCPGRRYRPRKISCKIMLAITRRPLICRLRSAYSPHPVEFSQSLSSTDVTQSP